MKLQEDLLKKASKLVFGSERSLKLLKNDKLERIYLAENCKEDLKEEIKRYGGKAEVIELDMPNGEIGTICKKPFSISVVGLNK